jgi:DMSO/TMAO reductase YedYZ molybdopterin-dependent catalytic subunit
MDRRDFLRLSASATLPAAWLGVTEPEGSARTHVSAEEKPVALIPRQKNPDNLEFPFSSLNSFLTPNNLFYVRNHFDAPELDAKKWRLQVVGVVKKPLELTHAQVLELSERTLPVTLECAGNGRAFLDPKTKGVQWQLGAVSTAEWTGVTLASILERAGPRADAVDVVLEGNDMGEPAGEPRPVGKIRFARGLPLAKAMKPDVLLAHRMNGKTLPRAHGFPLRAVVAGWYGMASVKWLRRIVVTDRPFRGYDETTDYAIWERRHDLATLTPITEMEVKASIARPAAGEMVAPNTAYRIHGAAWAGETDVVKVAVSIDGGKNWATARLLDKPQPFCWRRWQYTWDKPTAGKHQLLARATDKRGRTQPLKRDPDRRNYMISHVTPIEVRVGE